MYFRNQNREQIFFFSKLKTLSMSIMSYPDIAALAAYLILLPPIHSEYLLFSPHWRNHCDSLGTELSPSSEMVSAMISQLYCVFWEHLHAHIHKHYLSQATGILQHFFSMACTHITQKFSQFYLCSLDPVQLCATKLFNFVRKTIVSSSQRLSTRLTRNTPADSQSFLFTEYLLSHFKGLHIQMLISYNSIYPMVIEFQHVLRHTLPLADVPDGHQFTSSCQKTQGKC